MTTPTPPESRWEELRREVAEMRSVSGKPYAVNRNKVLAIVDRLAARQEPAIDVERLYEAIWNASSFDPASQYVDVKRVEVREFTETVAAEYDRLGSE